MRDDDEMGTFFDARTRIAHFRFEAHARENRATDDASSTHQPECLACRASLLAFTRVVRATSKKIKRTGVQRDDDDVPATRAILFVVIEK